MKKKILSLLLVLVMLLGLLPTAALAAAENPTTQLPAAAETSAQAEVQAAEPEQTADVPAAQEAAVLGRIHVIAKNQTWTTAMESSGNKKPAWYGTRTDLYVDLREDSTMMSCIAEALNRTGYKVVGAEEGYIRSIGGVGEFGNGPESGWMGTLNGWFTNKGFAEYSVADGTLKLGDEISVEYTSTGLGKDLGADWESGDKSLSNIKVNSKHGLLMPAFSSEVHEYVALVQDGVTGVTIVPTATNRQFQVHMYVGETEYPVTTLTTIPVVDGSVLTIKCGDPSWETSAPNGAEPQVYTVKIKTIGSLLNENAVSVHTIKEDGTSEGDDATMTYDAKKGILTATTVRKYTELAQYNDVGFTATLSGLPEGTTAELFAENGDKLGDFVDGKITRENDLRTVGKHNYTIVLKNGELEEVYQFVVSKSPDMRLYGGSNREYFKATPAYNSENVFHGQPEGTLFRADRDGNLTGEVGYEGNCWNYVMYVSPDVTAISPTSSFQAYDKDLRNNSDVKIYVNGELMTAQEGLTAARKIWINSPTVLDRPKNEYVVEFLCRTDPTIVVHFKLTVYVVKTTPAELTEKINALPAPDDLLYERDYGSVISYDRVYEGYTDEEKAQVPADTVKKLKDCVAKAEVLKERYESGIQELADIIRRCADGVTAENYRDYLDDVRKSVELYLGLSDAQRTGLKSVQYSKTENMVDAFWKVYNVAILQSIKNGDSLGYPTDYPDDFIIQSGYYNLDLGHEDTYYQTGFREIWTNRPSTYYQYVEKGLPFTSPGLLEFDIKDESIFEIKEVESVYKDMGLGGSGEHPNMLYYLVPKKPGTTTFTVKLCDDKGVLYCQTPEIVVHVNSPEESATENLYQKLTDFTSYEYTRRYDNWTYEYGKEGAEFSFHINGDNGKVWVYDYLQFHEDGTPVKTAYTPDANGDVTILLKDGYNCIEVNADYEGQNVTQVYSLKGKVVKNVVENISRPGEPLRLGDDAGVWIIGRPICLHKILRIYNNSNGATRYITDMPRQGLLKTDETININYIGFVGGEKGGFSRLLVPLTASGDILLHDGFIQHAGYGSGLGSELTQGNTGGMADSTQFKFGQLSDILLKGVQDNPNYVPPETMQTTASNGGVVRAGESITVTVPTLPTETILSDYERDEQNRIRYATTRFYTNIPGLAAVEVSYYSKSSNMGVGVDSVNDIKAITFTVPASTPAGTYNIHGGNVELGYTKGWMDYYDWLYRGLIDDVAITVLPGAQQDVIDLIDAIGTVTTASGPAITAARSAYDALTGEQKALVSNYQKLLDAEAVYGALTGTNTPAAPAAPAVPAQQPQNENHGSGLPFTDVAEGSWYYDGVKYAYASSLMNGTGANTFSPNAETTRGMIVTILARMEGQDTSGTPWYAAGQKWAMANGISDGTNMTGKITREQLAAMLYRYAKMKGYDVSASASLSGYTDASSVSGWAVEAMQWAVGSGLMQGSGNALAPQTNATRAQIAAILMRFAQNIAK